MNFNLKRVLYSLVVALLLSSTILTSSVFAHSASSCNSGSESSGWKVNCTSTHGHLGTSSTTYQYSPTLTQQYKNYTSTGASRWNNTGIVNISQSSSSGNIIYQHSDPNTSTVAYVTSQTFNNHKSSWFMSYNHSKMNGRTSAANNGTATHEFGHSIGIADLYNSSNKNKIMYGYEDRTVTVPQTADKTGAREAIK
ncbi:hypothetical protein ABE096_21595 [Robertmurraya massiliosenegalensis]|uniref:hypothetical protein n=1 Tax=Robertmurraya TaxID=2837507 RepID=UPI0039A54B58